MHEINSTKGERFETEKFELHPSFSNDSFYDDFDVAIVTVKGKIQFNKNVAPICLPSAENFHVGENAITAGWWLQIESWFHKYKIISRGKLGEGKKSASSKALMQTQVQIKSEKDCKKMTKALITFNPKSMICAYAKKTDACQVRSLSVNRWVEVIRDSRFRATLVGWVLFSSTRPQLENVSSSRCLLKRKQTVTKSLESSHLATDAPESFQEFMGNLRQKQRSSGFGIL